MNTYHVYQNNANTLKKVRMTRYPMTKEECRVFVSKMPDYNWAWYSLEGSEEVFPAPKEIIHVNGKRVK